MRLPPTQIAALRQDLGREPTPVEERIIRQAVHLQVLIDKDQKAYDQQQPQLTLTGSQGQTKIINNPLADRITKNIERLARILHYLDKPNHIEGEDVNPLLEEIMSL